MSPYSLSPKDRLAQLGERVRQLRMQRALTQQELAERAEISRKTLIRFESSGVTSTGNLLRIAVALGADEPFDSLFAAAAYSSLDEALAQSEAPSRQRVRRRS